MTVYLMCGGDGKRLDELMKAAHRESMARIKKRRKVGEKGRE